MNISRIPANLNFITAYRLSRGLLLGTCILMPAIGTCTQLQNDRFLQHISDACFLRVSPAQLDIATLSQSDLDDLTAVCAALFAGSIDPDIPVAVSVNFNTSTDRLRKRANDNEDEFDGKRKKGDGGSFDIGGFGFNISSVSGDTTRSETLYEEGFNSDLDSNSFGIDYTFNDIATVGFLKSGSTEKAKFLNGSGGTKTETDTQMLYVDWQIVEGLSADFYSGTGDSDYSYTRQTQLAGITGVIWANYSGEQDLSGYSLNYDYSIGDFSVGAYYAIDQIDTDIDAYAEQGLDADTGMETLLELQFPQQSIKSKTDTLGLRASYAFTFSWGTLLPGYEVANVEEKENDKRFVQTRLLYTPNYYFALETDAPDRKYQYKTFSLILALNNGLQLYYNKEDRSGHAFIDDSATTIGVLYAF